MSFCNSKHPHDKCRIFDDEEIYLNIEEERNACLEKGYLRKIINIINPRLIIFFHWNAYIYKDLIFEIKDEPFERKFKAHVKKGLQVNTIFRALTIDDTKILFLPHPRFLATIKNLPNKLVSFIRELKWNVEGGEN
jgi:site-specific DNA-adenine methylase